MYFSYLTPKNKDPVTLVRNELIGFSEGVDRSTQTEEFLTVVERYADELPPEKEQEYRARGQLLSRSGSSRRARRTQCPVKACG
jgi:nucleoid-associated protein YejK